MFSSYFLSNWTSHPQGTSTPRTVGSDEWQKHRQPIKIYSFILYLYHHNAYVLVSFGHKNHLDRVRNKSWLASFSKSVIVLKLLTKLQHWDKLGVFSSWCGQHLTTSWLNCRQHTDLITSWHSASSLSNINIILQQVHQFLFLLLLC